MTRFARIASRHDGESYRRFLYVGGASDRRSTLVETAAASGRFDRVETIDLAELRRDYERGIERDEFAVDTYHGCLIVAWDLSPDWAGQELADVLEALPLSRPGRRSAGLVSLQKIMFGVTEPDQPLSFRGFTSAIRHDFAGIGDVARCVDALERWCRPVTDGGRSIDASLLCPKAPSAWVQHIRHDYFGNAIVLDTRRLVTEAGLWDQQRTMDFWQDAVRNVLAFPRTNSPSRSLLTHTWESEVEIARTVYSKPLQLVSPQATKPVLESCGWQDGVEFSLYGSEDQAAERLAAAGRQGSARVLICDPSFRAPQADDAGAARFIPRVLLGEQEHRASWGEWTQLLAGNVIGSFSFADFADSGDGEPIAARKASDYWRPFCCFPLQDAVNEIVDTMIRTYENLEARLPAERSTALTSIYRCLAQVWCARALYFGDSNVESELQLQPEQANDR